MERRKTTNLLAAATLAALALAGCLSRPAAEAPGLDEAVGRWIKGLHDEDIELTMSAYWPEAELLMPHAEGGEQLLQGAEAIRGLQQSGFDLPMSFGELMYTEVDRQVGFATATVRIHVGAADWTNVNILQFQRRGEEWRIIHQVLDRLAEE